MPEIIIRKKAPYPVFGGSLPSQKGGRRVTVLAGVDQDGGWHAEVDDTGEERLSNEPILFVPFGGVDYALNKRDLKEMIAGMRERHLKWREEQAPRPDLTAALKEFCAAIIHYQKGRQRFFFKEGIK